MPVRYRPLTGVHFTRLGNDDEPVKPGGLCDGPVDSSQTFPASVTNTADVAA
jgi:hypothetical protein